MSSKVRIFINDPDYGSFYGKRALDHLDARLQPRLPAGVITEKLRLMTRWRRYHHLLKNRMVPLPSGMQVNFLRERRKLGEVASNYKKYLRRFGIQKPVSNERIVSPRYGTQGDNWDWQTVFYSLSTRVRLDAMQALRVGARYFQSNGGNYDLRSLINVRVRLITRFSPGLPEVYTGVGGRSSLTPSPARTAPTQPESSRFRSPYPHARVSIWR